MNEFHDNMYRPYFKTKLTNKKYGQKNIFFRRKSPILIYSVMLIKI